MGKYINSGKQVLFDNGAGVLSHIGDMRDNEASHAFATAMNERSSNFIQDALRTCSPNFYGDRVSRSYFKHTLNEAIDVLRGLDKIKKSLFYGRDNNIAPDKGAQDSTGIRDLVAGGIEGISRYDEAQVVAVDIIHGILGKATEAGELLEALKAAINGDKLDLVNVNEEIGDGFWYDAIILNRTDSTFEEVQAKIIAKLRARFPDKYADASANERNLEAERAILEDRANPLTDDADGYVPLPEEVSANASGISIPSVLEVDTGLYDPRNAITPPLEPNKILVNKPLLAPSEPASGKSAVEEAEASANAAFSKINAIKDSARKVEDGPNLNPELAKPIGERLRNMPQENMARAAEHDKKNDG